MRGSGTAGWETLTIPECREYALHRLLREGARLLLRLPRPGATPAAIVALALRRSEIASLVWGDIMPTARAGPDARLLGGSRRFVVA